MYSDEEDYPLIAKINKLFTCCFALIGIILAFVTIGLYSEIGTSLVNISEIKGIIEYLAVNIDSAPLADIYPGDYDCSSGYQRQSLPLYVWKVGWLNKKSIRVYTKSSGYRMENSNPLFISFT